MLRAYRHWPLALSLSIISLLISLQVPSQAAFKSLPENQTKLAAAPETPSTKNNAVPKKEAKKSSEQKLATALGTEIANPLVLSDEQRTQLTAQTIQDLEKLALALQYETNSVSQDLQDDQELMTKDVAMLWQAAVERSSAIRFALEKLSRQDETGKPVQNNGMPRRLAQSAARMAGVASSMITASPAGMIGGGMIEQMLLDDPTSSALQRVTDADMVILAKEVESLQSRVIEMYYSYKQSKERLLLTEEASDTLGKYYDQYEHSIGQKNADPALDTILSSLYESAKQDEGQAKQSYVNARNELAMVVGPDALNALESAHAKEKAAE